MLSAKNSESNANFFFNSRRAVRFVNLLGSRDRARIFYAALGFGLIVFGGCFALGIFEEETPKQSPKHIKEESF